MTVIVGAIVIAVFFYFLAHIGNTVGDTEPSSSNDQIAAIVKAIVILAILGGIMFLIAG